MTDIESLRRKARKMTLRDITEEIREREATINLCSGTLFPAMLKEEIWELEAWRLRHHQEINK